MAEIEIKLCIDQTEISFLSIPRNDIERLAVSPFRWLRYVMFAICGARGDLSTTSDGPAVDYEKTEIGANENTYYYRPSGPCAFVDYKGLNDRITTTEGTTRRIDFRDDVIRRDGPACVITEEDEDDCDAAHLIPHSKGDEYIRRLIQLRSPEDDSTSRIDMTENGIFLSKTVHSKLGRGQVALIKTPNFGLGPEDIKRFRRGDERQVNITMQWIEKPERFNPKNLELFQTIQNAGAIPPLNMTFHDAAQNVDALFGGEGVPLPLTVILDYFYGMAAYKAWHTDDSSNQMKAYRDRYYAQIPPHIPPAPKNDDDDSSGPDNANESDYKHFQPRKHKRSGLEETMSELNMFFMYVQGITPEMAAERRQKEIEQEERAAQEASRSKVMEWRNLLDD